MKKTILLTFGRSFLSLSFARIFASAGYRVVVVDSIDFSLSKFSNSVHAFYRVTSPAKNPSGYIEDLIFIANKEKVDLVLPMWEDICHVARAKDQFPKKCTVFCPDFTVYDKLLNKWTFQGLLESLKIDHPKTELINNISDLEKLQLVKAVALKPVYSRASQHIVKVTPGEPMPNICIHPDKPWVAQEWIEGNSFCTYSICRNGHLLAHSTYPVRYTVDGHNCLTFQYVEHKGIFDWVKSLVSQINYTGQIAFDFIETPEGVLHAIECNPRATSGMLLFERNKGLDQVFFHTPIHVLTPFSNARRQIATGMAMYGWKKGSNFSKKLTGFVKELFTTRDVVLSRRDPIPFIIQPYLFARMLFESRKIGLSISNFYINDHIWDGD